MTRNNEAFYGMALKVANFGTKNSAALGTIAAIPPLFTNHQTLVDELETADAGSRADLTGYAIDKNNKRDVVELLSLKVSNALASYAVVENDVILRKRADYPTSHWDRVSEEGLSTDAQIVHGLALPLAASLEDYGASALDITSLGTAIETFIGVISNPSLATDVRKYDNEEIRMTIDKIRILFSDKLDVLMRSFEVSNPELYNLYRSARAIDINGSITPPVAVVNISAGEMMVIYTKEPYEANTLFTFQNMSDTDAIEVSLSTDENNAGPNPVLVPANETRQRIASNLAAEGIFIMAVNTGSSTVTLRLWVD